MAQEKFQSFVGKLEETEFQIMENGYLEKYESLVRNSESDKGRQDYIDQIRYMLALAHTANNQCFGGEFRFIGGMGVLGNLIDVCGDGAIEKWRGTRDLDLLIKDRAYSYVIECSFDEVDVAQKSMSIPNKYTFRGASIDYQGHKLPACSIDAYFPGSNPNHGIKIDKVTIDNLEWSNGTKINLFGIPFYCLDPLNLLNMKLQVQRKDSFPRRQDCQDIYNLLGVCEHKEIDPKWVKTYIPGSDTSRLSKVLEQARTCMDSGRGFVISPSEKYMGRVLR